MATREPDESLPELPEQDASRPGKGIHTHSAEETRTVGRQLATNLDPGEVILLFGELGSGKTCFVQGLAEGFGLDPRRVHSPSFIMVNRYDCDPPLHHVDLYRLKEGEDFSDLGLEELFAGEGIAVVEWAERLPPVARPVPRREVHLSHLGETERWIRICRIRARGSGGR